MEKKKNMLGNVTFEGDVTFHGPMFDIHDNENVYLSVDKAKVNVNDGSAGSPQENDNENVNEELFHFVYPELNEAEAWRIHDAVKRVVKLQGIQMVCQYLTQLKNEKKVLLPPNPSTAYMELVRMGMPNGEGFNETTFRKYYNK